MLHSISGGSTLPRDVIKWLDALDLSYSVRNPKMDLSNGFIVAQILTRKYSNELSIYTFYNSLAKDKKVNNWQQIQKFLSKKSFRLSRQDYESIINMGPQTATAFLFRLYEFITESKLNIDRRLSSTLQSPVQPLYSKHTASSVAKDRQLHRVVDNKQKEKRTKVMIQKHKNDIHTQKYNTGLIQWLIRKRKQEIENEVMKQKQQIQKRTQSVVNSDSKVQVKEIQLKCFNSSTSKKVKGQYGEYVDNKGVLQFLTESCSLILKKDNIVNDIKKLGLDNKDKQQNSITVLQEIFKRCHDTDQKGNRKITTQTLKRLVEQFKKAAEMSIIIDNIHNNFQDFKKLFELLINPLKIYDRQSQVYKGVIDLITIIANGLHKVSSQNAQLMFEDILAGDLLRIGENEYKRISISNLCLSFVRKKSQSYYNIIQKVKQLYRNDLKIFIAYLAQFITIISKECENVQENLWGQFLFYGFSCLTNMCPSVRVNGTKIISKIFSDLVIASDDIINQKLNLLKNLIVDPWWQVRAQALIIFKSIMLNKYKNESKSADINNDLTMKTILHYILQIFQVNVSHNILRIGLIQLAELLNYEDKLCQRYLQILLHVGNQIRTDVLTVNVIKYGPVVYGANTFSYQLTAAPLVWNSIGIAKVLDQYITKNHISQLQKPHLEILHSALLKHQANKSQQWLHLFQAFKQKIFISLLDDQLCSLSTSVIRSFMEITQIHNQVMNKSKEHISQILSRINLNYGQSNAKQNLLQFFKYLKQLESQYTYQILKQFAEKEVSKYLGSNLVQFTNQLSRDRRKKLYDEQ